jgi:DNA-binding MurR/RpiR family transcriptional regulator
VTARIRAQIPALLPSEAGVAAVILDDLDGVIHRSVTDVAVASGAGVSTVVRCDQHLGVQGLSGS